MKHNISYNSTDCEFELLKKTISDSKITNKISCGRTKCTSMVVNVMSPFQLEQDLSYLKTKKIIFSIQTDASNNKNRKFIPICTQYFSKENGRENKLIDFIENANETALGMPNVLACIQTNLSKQLILALKFENQIIPSQIEIYLLFFSHITIIQCGHKTTRIK